MRHFHRHHHHRGHHFDQHVSQPANVPRSNNPLITAADDVTRQIVKAGKIVIGVAIAGVTIYLIVLIISAILHYAVSHGL